MRTGTLRPRWGSQHRRHWSRGLLGLAVLMLAACSEPEPTSAGRLTAVDALHEQVQSNAEAAADLVPLLTIDHARLAAETGAHMPPARVSLIHAVAIELALVAEDPRIALDLPVRVLAFESPEGTAAVTFNDADYLRGRYGLDPDSAALDGYRSALGELLQGFPEGAVQPFASNRLETSGVIEIVSDFGFDETIERLRDSVMSQGDTVWFGEVDYRALAGERGRSLPPATLLLFGAPEPGGKAMAEAPTLGLDGFCQKLVVWQAANGDVRVAYNDLLVLAERQGVGFNVPLRVIQYRLGNTFEGAVLR